MRRPIGSLDRRLSEAARLGFSDAITPTRVLRAHGTAAVPVRMRLHEVSSLHEAITKANQLSRSALTTTLEGTA